MKYILLLFCFLINPVIPTMSYSVSYSTAYKAEIPPVEKNSAKKKKRKRQHKFKSKRKKRFFKELTNKGMLAGGIVLVVFGSIFLAIGLLFIIALIGFSSSILLFFALIGLLGGISMLIPGIILIARSKKSGRTSTTKKEDAVYLNNGSILRGKIVEINHPETVKIELAGGSVMVIDYDDIDRIESK